MGINMSITNKSFNRKPMLAVLPLIIVLGACADTHTQLQAGDGIAPPSVAELHTMAEAVYRYNVDNSPTKLRVNTLRTTDAMVLLPGDKSDFLVCFEWEGQETYWTYQHTSPRYQMTQSNPIDPLPSGVSLISKPGDPLTRYGAYVARLEDGTNWSPVLFKRENQMIGARLINTLCRQPYS